jgi:hypothetical protein
MPHRSTGSSAFRWARGEAPTIMTVRGNKRPGVTATILFALIIVATVAIIWFALRALDKESNGKPAGSQTLPAQAAQRAGLAPEQPPVLVDAPPKQ